MVYKSLTYIINSINANKKIILLRYTPILYSIVMILEREFRLVKTSFVFKK